MRPSRKCSSSVASNRAELISAADTASGAVSPGICPAGGVWPASGDSPGATTAASNGNQRTIANARRANVGPYRRKHSASGAWQGPSRTLAAHSRGTRPSRRVATGQGTTQGAGRREATESGEPGQRRGESSDGARWERRGWRVASRGTRFSYSAIQQTPTPPWSGGVYRAKVAAAPKRPGIPPVHGRQARRNPEQEVLR